MKFWLKILARLSIGVFVFIAIMATKIIYETITHKEKRILNGFVVRVDKGVIDSVWVVPAYRDTTKNPDGSLHVEFADTLYWMRIVNTKTGHFQDWTVSKFMLEIHQKGDHVVMNDSKGYKEYMDKEREDYRQLLRESKLVPMREVNAHTDSVKYK